MKHNTKAPKKGGKNRNELNFFEETDGITHRDGQTMHPLLDDLTVQVIYLISYYTKKTQKNSAFGSYRYKNEFSAIVVICLKVL